MDITFALPYWLAAGILLLSCTYLFIRFTAIKRRQDLERFAAPNLLAHLTGNVSVPMRQTKKILFLLGLFCCFLALARPQYGNRWVEVKRKGIDILFGVDTSKSMMARDVLPNRLDRAKLAIADFVSRLEGDRVGLMPFAGSSFLMCPLTTDYEAFNRSLQALDTTIIPKGGTDIGDAIRRAETVLANEANHKILILVTDGENLDGNPLEAAREAKEHKMTIFTVGVGTPQGELIPDPAAGEGNFLKDRSGKYVTSRLDEKTLTRIAEETGGLYVPLGSTGQGFETIYQKKLALVPKEEHGRRLDKLPIERFQWPLAAALCLLGVDFLLIGRKKNKKSWSLNRHRISLRRARGRRSGRDRTMAAILLLALAALHPVASHAEAEQQEQEIAASPWSQQEEIWRKILAEDPDNPVVQFNLGDAAYKKGAFDQAIAFFNQALYTDDLDLQARSYYNRGNAQYRLGEQNLQTDPEHTIKLWQEAITSYEGCLALNPEDSDATYNRNLVKKRLDKLKKQQRQKKKKKQQDKDKRQKSQKQQKQQESKKQKQGQKKDSRNQSGTNQQQDKQNSNQKPDPGQPKEQEQKNSVSETDENQSNGQQNKEKKTQPGQPEQADKQQNTDQDNSRHSADNNSRSRGKAGDQGLAGRNKDDAQRRKQGKMTVEEAKRLLDALKGEEGELRFIPPGDRNAPQSGRNW
ncbi:VWA domain-containing protein [Desulfolithobacter sp.]